MSSDEEERQRRIAFAWQMPGNGTRDNPSGSRSPSSRTRTSRRGSEHDDLLLHDETNVWHTEHERNQLYQPPPASTTTSPIHPAIFHSPPPPSPTLITISPPHDQPEAADSDPDSDFELVDSDTPPYIDGNNDNRVTPYKYIPAALRQHQVTRSIRNYLKPRDQWDHDEDWPATAGANNTMEGDNEYDQPEWNQAGPHADAQDLAGPGEHGLLQCTVTKPQKEGEGTQNLYVSYLVTTDV
jgi:sorting nexin-4